VARETGIFRLEISLACGDIQIYGSPLYFERTVTNAMNSAPKAGPGQPQASYIRKATAADASRIAEIYVFNNRLVYFPILGDALFSFRQLQVRSYIQTVEQRLADTYVYDDGILKGFIVITGKEIKKLHVDHFFQGQGIGGCLLRFAVQGCCAEHVWVFEKNENALAFYKKNGFTQTSEKNDLLCTDGHKETLVKMALPPKA